MRQYDFVVLTGGQPAAITIIWIGLVSVAGVADRQRGRNGDNVHAVRADLRARRRLVNGDPVHVVFETVVLRQSIFLQLLTSGEQFVLMCVRQIVGSI